MLVHASTDSKTISPGDNDRGRESRAPQHALEAFQREFDYLCRTLQRLGVREADVEDLVHEVFLVLDRRWRDYDPSRPLRPYLFGIAFRVAASHRRRNVREIPGDVPDVPDTRAAPDQVLSAAEARTLVLRALESGETSAEEVEAIKALIARYEAEKGSDT